MSIITPKDYIYEIIEEMQFQFAQHTCAIFIDNRKQQPDQVASGVFFKHNERYYLLSAAHTVNDAIDAGRKLFISDKSHFVPLVGPAIKTRSNDKKEDNIDVAIIRIDQIVPELQGIQFITEEFTSYKRSFSDSCMYFIQGYPNSRNKTNEVLDLKTKNFDSFVYTYAAPLATDADYSKYQKHPIRHIAVFYGNQRKDGTSPIKPTGMSGGGLWIVPNIHETPKHYFLCGICIEHHSPYIFATKIETIFELLEKFNI